MFTRITLLAALITLPQIASAAPAATFEAPDLRPRAARRIDQPVVVDRQDLERDIDALSRDIAEMETIVATMPRGRGMRRTRRALRRQIDQMRGRLAHAQAELRQAPILVATGRGHRRGHDHRPSPRPVYQPVTAHEMGQLIRALERAPYRDDDMRIIRQAAARHHFTVAQAVRLVEQLPYSDDRVNALVTLYPTLVDPQNDHLLYSALRYPSDRQALERRLARL